MDGDGVRQKSTAIPLKADWLLPVSIQCYSVSVIHRTCYAFTDRAYLWLEPANAGDHLTVAIAAKSNQENLDHLVGEFCNALIDFAVRETVARETKEIRETIVRTALAEASP